MKNPPHHYTTLTALVVGVLGALSASAADNSFYNTVGDYRWFTAGNWQAGIPDNTSTVYLNTAGKTSPANPLVITSATEKAKASNLNVAWGNNDRE